MKCSRCRKTAVVALPSHHAGFCEECFLLFFSRQVERGVKNHKLMTKEDRILVALSGGKDSLSLILELKRQGFDVAGLHVDLGIPDSSSHARAKVEAFCSRHDLSLRVIELEKEGLPIPEVKKAVQRPICSMCGKIKRYYFNQAAMEGGFTVQATGHNLDDEVSRLMANVLRWDAAYLSDQGPVMPAENGFVRKVKPFYRLTEFETANYAFLMDIDMHKAGCPYSKGATFTGHKRVWYDIEHNSPGQKLQFYEGFLKQGRAAFQAVAEKHGDTLSPCVRCGYPTSAELCGVCRVRNILAGK